MIYRFLALVAVSAGMTSPLLAQTGEITEPYIGCLTDEGFDQLYSAISSGDTRLRDDLMGSVCVPVQGYQYSMLDRGMLRSKIRVYVGSDHVDLIVPAEAAQ